MSYRRVIHLFVLSLFATSLLAATVACGGQAVDPITTISASDTAIPTFSASPTPTTSQIRPLALQASLSPPVIAVGDSLTVRTDSGGSGIPQYTLSVDDTVISVVRWDGSLVQDNPSDVAEVSEWESGPSSAEWKLNLHKPGDHIVTIFVSGEIGASVVGPFYFTSGTQRFQFMVTSAD